MRIHIYLMRHLLVESSKRSVKYFLKRTGTCRPDVHSRPLEVNGRATLRNSGGTDRIPELWLNSSLNECEASICCCPLIP
jgi:hypothetical protein